MKAVRTMRQAITLGSVGEFECVRSRRGRGITASHNCDSPEIKIEFHSFPLAHLPPSPSLLLSLWRLNNRCHAKRAVTAVPEWLCQQQRWGWAFQPAHRAGKIKGEVEEKESLWSPNDARWEPSGTKFCRVVPPFFLPRGPRTPIYRHSHIGPFCMAGPRAAVFSRKKMTTTQ